MKTDILIIGGGPAGVTCAVTARKNYPKKRVVLIRKQKKAVIPCAIPYIFCRLNSIDENLLPDKILEDNQIKVLIGEAVDISVKDKKVKLKSGKRIEYEKLILATGSEPILIPIKGIEKQGVFLVKKDYEYLKKLRKAVLFAKNIVIIGGGFIGVEFAEEISNFKDKKISIIEKAEHCLSFNFDDEFIKIVEKKLKEKGVKIYLKKSVEEIGGAKAVEYVKLDDKEKIPADLVILSIGARPNTKLAEKAGIRIEEKGTILVDEYLRTNIKDIFAVGDCAQTKHFLTGENVSVMLASVACSEARIAVSNLYKIKALRENKGTLGAFSTCVAGLGLGVAGLTEKMAEIGKYNYIIGTAEVPDHHPGSLPETKSISVKLIFLKGGEKYLLGGEIMGPEKIGEMVNIIALAVQQGLSAFDFQNFQISTHPLLTSSPIAYPLIAAAQDAIKKMDA